MAKRSNGNISELPVGDIVEKKGVLPILNAPRYSTTLPSNGMNIKFRPFLVKEEKALMIAMQSNDNKVQLEALVDILKACIEQEIDFDNMPVFDLEWLFLQLRTKSAGDNIDVKIVCSNPDCRQTSIHSVDLSSVECVTSEEHTNKIELTDNIGIILSYPTLETTVKYDLDKIKNNDVDTMFSMIIDSIEKIYVGDDVYKSEDISRDEISAFVDSMQSKQFEKVNKFFETMPKCKTDLKWECVNCKTKNETSLEGLKDFFG